MCGICGIINFKNQPADVNSINTMMLKMKHRGPDDNGIFVEKNVGLGFVRLSILDLSYQGHQPMFDESNRYVIIHNGEVYNFIELRDELKKKGYSFFSNTDTEVILKAYMEWNESCLDKFNGMWAFAIYDKMKNELFISRDRYGIKPFYYYLDENQFIFASEIAPILSVLKTKPSPDYQSIFDYLVFNRTDQTEATFFHQVKKLQHGYCLKVTQDALPSYNKDGWYQLAPKVFVKKWYDLRERVEKAEGFKSSEEFKDTFSSAVGLRLRSDVPVGVCLSGGLDSSSIVAVLLKDYHKNDVHTFSAVYEKGQSGDESEYIAEFKPVLQNMFFTHPTAVTLFEDMEQFVKAHGEPLPSTSPYAQFKVMQLAREHVVVTLDGQGADEELAGYHYFYGLFFKDLLRQLNFLTLNGEMIHYLIKHQSLYGLKTFLYFLLPKDLRTRVRVKEKGYINPEFIHAYSKNNTIAGNLYGSPNLQQALVDHFEYKLEHLLKWEDRNSMWFSLESRVPFLDYRLVEKILSMDGQTKIKKGMTKAILREAMKGLLPEKIRIRKDKIGFGTPQSEWFRTEMFQKFIRQLLQSDAFRARKIINADAALELYKQHVTGKMDIAKEIWKWIHLELWFRTFIDQKN
ncbi:asparagine synthase (glutamine-hydrolyzing) [Melioribacter sp. OK-6-Me]|uniref:asparagine synthase (glutamine-hydrolyzing) n=1 Tax=Melioribacter sp. OK-6-Me TaxID=3423433 RepID=UPI003ED859BF